MQRDSKSWQPNEPYVHKFAEKIAFILGGNSGIRLTTAKQS